MPKSNCIPISIWFGHRLPFADRLYIVGIGTPLRVFPSENDSNRRICRLKCSKEKQEQFFIPCEIFAFPIFYRLVVFRRIGHWHRTCYGKLDSGRILVGYEYCRHGVLDIALQGGFAPFGASTLMDFVFRYHGDSSHSFFAVSG